MNKKLLSRFLIEINKSIFDAMKAMNSNWRSVVFVKDNLGGVVGVITDGDIRRGLLKGLGVKAPLTKVMQKNFLSVDEQTDRETVLDLMMARRVAQIPVLDEQKFLKGVHFLHDLVGINKRNNIAVIMAGGLGKRLRPATEYMPKPMVKVAGRPILERIVLHLVGHGIRKIYISVNYLGKIIEDYFRDGSKFGCEISYLREKKALGTGGALTLLKKILDQPILVMNGDLITQINVGQMFDFHSRGKYCATIGAKIYSLDVPVGVLNKKKNLLVGIQEKPTVSYLVNTGVYILNPEILKLIPKNRDYPITNLFLELLSLKKKVGVFEIEDDWIGIEKQGDLQRVNGLL